MNKKIKYCACLLLLTLTACESWLDIKPVDRISGRALFETRQGFLKALNGVYVELTDRSVYGREMTAGIIDAMAQYYYVDGTNNLLDALRRYQYDDSDIKGRFNNLWSKTYNQIVNLNIIIEECGQQNDVLNGIWHPLIKGEALALRAFLHLDMMRIFGPTYSADPNGVYLPYVTNSDQTVMPLLACSEFKELLLKDLTDAIELLGQSDPVIENGVMLSDAADGDNTLRYRQYRMNFYAARALLARAYLWFGDTDKAYTTATQLLADIGDTVFPFVDPAQATKSSNPDRVFSPEVMFALYDNKRTTEIYDKVYTPTNPNTGEIYRLAYTGSEVWSGRVSQLFVTPNDIRYKSWISSYSPQGGGVLHYIGKYKGEEPNTQRPQHMFMVPLIRLSEVYLIAAECAPAMDESKGYLSALRTARGAYDLESPDRNALMYNIEWEYRREFLCEGQMFYFYKRLGRPSIPAGEYDSSTEVIQMGQSQYVVPLPESETNERVDNLNK